MRSLGHIIFGLLPPRVVFHANRLGAAKSCSWETVVAQVCDARHQTEVVGFDVYDTLLTRRLPDTEGLEATLATLLVGEGAWTDSPESYLAARAEAKQAFPSRGLKHWYRHGPLAAHSDSERCQKVELGLEERITTPVAGAVEALARIRATGIRIAFISDMHLPSSFLEGLLEDHGLKDPDEAILVSGELGRTKSTGDLFKYWLAEEKCKPHQAMYVGNHPYSDIAVPTSGGIRVVPRTEGNCNRYEHAMTQSGIVGSVVAGASIQARLKGQAASAATHTLDGQQESCHGIEQSCVSVGASVVGQTLMAFLLAIRARAKEAGINQLLFVARDGDLPLRMARAMPAEYWSGTSMHYLHGNRLTWTLAGAHTVGVDKWIDLGTFDEHAFLLRAQQRVTAGSLLGRIGLGVDNVAHINGLATINEDKPLPQAETMWSEILADATVREKIADTAKTRYELAAQYLIDLELGLEKSMLIDIGWRGQTAAMISPLFTSVLGHEPLNYHFGGYGVKHQLDHLCRTERYAFDDGQAPPPFHAVDQAVEMFTGAGRPRAIGYQHQESVVPIFDKGIEAMRSQERELIWASAIEMASCMPNPALLDEWTPDRVPEPTVATEILKAFWTTPTRAEGKMGALLNLEVDEAGASTSPVAKPYSFRELVPKNRTIQKDLVRRWPAGSAAASGFAFRMLHKARPRQN